MSTKKKEISVDEVELAPQTETSLVPAELINPEGSAPDEGAAQTGSEMCAKLENSVAFQAAEQTEEPLLQTETDPLPEVGPQDMPEGQIPQTGTGDIENLGSPAEESPDPAAEPSTPQTEPAKKPKRGRTKKTAEIPSQSDTEPTVGEKDIADGVEEKPGPVKKRSVVRPTRGVLAIDDRLTVETEADKARNDLLDLLESQKSGRILTGTIQGVERAENDQTRALAVIYHGEFKVIIPAEEAVEPPADYRGRLPEDVMHYMLTKRLGAEVDYIVKGIDSESGIAAASRLEAMKAKRKQYFWGTDRDGNNLIYSGVCAEARVVSVIRAGIFVDLFGLEIYIPLRELSYQRMMDAAAQFQPGQRILVKVLEVERSDRDHIQVTASVKQAGENPYERALRRYSVGNRYVGTVSMVDTNGVFVALDGGIDCLCSYPKRGRPPRGSRVTVRILGINHESNRIWGAITHIAVPR